jgi:hypothetical protein
MMKEKLDEQQRQLQKQLTKYENNDFDDFEKAFDNDTPQPPV